MTPEALATLHALCFGTTPRPWSAAEFADLLKDPANLLTADPGGAGFAMARRAGPEAEILTICTAPDSRGRGIGRRLLEDLHARLAARGVDEVFLEVADTNAAARALYAAAGYVPVGYRKDYYDGGSGARVHAHVLRKSLAVAPDAASTQK